MNSGKRGFYGRTGDGISSADDTANLSRAKMRSRLCIYASKTCSVGDLWCEGVYDAYYKIGCVRLNLSFKAGKTGKRSQGNDVAQSFNNRVGQSIKPPSVSMSYHKLQEGSVWFLYFQYPPLCTKHVWFNMLTIQLQWPEEKVQILKPHTECYLWPLSRTI